MIVTFDSPVAGEIVGIASVEEGRFAGGQWEHVRWLNGDQTHQGRHLRLEPGGSRFRGSSSTSTRVTMADSRRILVLSTLFVLPALGLRAQAPPSQAPAAPAAPANPFLVSPEERARLDQLARDDHADMLSQLGITRLRPGFDGRAAVGAPNAANYDAARANPYPDWPDALTLKDGRRVTTAETWWQERRPEIVEDFEREVYGRVPESVPKVTWTVAETVETTVGGQPVVARRVIGHVDNSAHPAITVDLKMAVVVPVHATGPVPVLIMFGWGNMPDEPVWRFPGMPEPAAPPSTEQLIAAGWGYVSLSTTSIQADNGAGLTAGIIGLANEGKRRTPEQWGALRAWAWGAARALDYLETLPAVDAKRVGIEGVSRYGKAALVTMAFEPRFAVVLVGSSGEGGAKPHRRNFGEAVENLTGSGAYHWMAGNFLKYGAAEASFGSRNASDIPVDAHELIALCAPRPTFVSYGVPEKGDANWLDQQGSYMATVAAGPVFRLLGARDLGVAEDYRVAQMPPVNTGLVEGQLAWRQHDGGHEDRTNTSSSSPGRTGCSTTRRPRFPGTSRGCAPTATPTSPTSSSWPRRRAEASISTSWAIPSPVAGELSTTRTSWPIGGRRSTGGTPATSAGAGIGRRTSCGAWRTGSWTA